MVSEDNMQGTGQGAASGFMAGGPWGAIIGAALGLAKDVEGKKQAADERKRQAAMTRYSPWTGMHGTTVQDPSTIGDVGQGAAAGLQMGQNYDRSRMMAANQQNAAGNQAFTSFKPQAIQSAQNPWANSNLQYDPNNPYGQK